MDIKVINASFNLQESCSNDSLQFISIPSLRTSTEQLNKMYNINKIKQFDRINENEQIYDPKDILQKKIKYQQHSNHS